MTGVRSLLRLLLRLLLLLLLLLPISSQLEQLTFGWLTVCTWVSAPAKRLR